MPGRTVVSRIAPSTAALLCVALLSPANVSVAGKKKEDDRLVIKAEFQPAAESEWRAWRVLIHDDGIIDVEFSEATPRRPPRLDGRQIQSLLTSVEGARFEQLEPSYSLVDLDEHATPESKPAVDRLILEVRTRDGLRLVTVETPEYAVGLADALDDHPRRSEIARFLKLWTRVVDRVRPPNPDQNTGLYRP